MPGIFTRRCWWRAATTASTTSPASCGRDLLGRVRRTGARPVGPRAHAAESSRAPVGGDGSRWGTRNIAAAASSAETAPTQYAEEPPASSATTPATQAPGAMPALTPVCDDSHGLVEARARAGRLDDGEQRDQRRRQGQAGDEQADGHGDQPGQQRQHRGTDGEQHQADPRPLHRRTTEGHRAGDHTGRARCRARRRRASARRPAGGPRRRPARRWPPPGRRTGCPGRVAPRVSGTSTAPRHRVPARSCGRAGGPVARCGAAGRAPPPHQCRAPARRAVRTTARAAWRGR